MASMQLSAVDYEGKIVISIFLENCNFRCPYCQNADLVLNNYDYSIKAKDLFEILKENKRNRAMITHDSEWWDFLRFPFLRRLNSLGATVKQELIKEAVTGGFIDGICVLGGEPTLNPALPKLIKKLKKMGYPVKLDTNGSNPEMLKDLLAGELVDYIAMDIKAPKEKYPKLAGVNVNMQQIQRSMNLIRENAPDYEFRTTIPRELLTREDIMKIGKWIDGSKRYVLQEFIPKRTLDPACEHCHSYTKGEMGAMADVLNNNYKIGEILVRYGKREIYPERHTMGLLV